MSAPAPPSKEVRFRSQTAVEGVAALTAEERVTATLTIQPIFAAVAAEDVIARTTVEDVGTGATPELIAQDGGLFGCADGRPVFSQWLE
nr:hypothetical protein [Kribbella catacumbae]